MNFVVREASNLIIGVEKFCTRSIGKAGRIHTYFGYKWFTSFKGYSRNDVRCAVDEVLSHARTKNSNIFSKFRISRFVRRLRLLLFSLACRVACMTPWYRLPVLSCGLLLLLSLSFFLLFNLYTKNPPLHDFHLFTPLIITLVHNFLRPMVSRVFVGLVQNLKQKASWLFTHIRLENVCYIER